MYFILKNIIDLLYDKFYKKNNILKLEKYNEKSSFVYCNEP